MVELLRRLKKQAVRYAISLKALYTSIYLKLVREWQQPSRFLPDYHIFN